MGTKISALPALTGALTAADDQIPIVDTSAVVTKRIDISELTAKILDGHVHAAADITSGLLANARIATGTPDGTKFLRDDQVWTVVSASDATKLPLAGGTMTGTITSTIGTITANTPALSGTQTWNNAAETFDGIRIDVTNTASAGASSVLLVNVDGVQRFRINTAGNIASTGTWSHTGIVTASSAINGAAFVLGSSLLAISTAFGGFAAGSAQLVSWSSTTAYSGTKDLGLARSAAGVVEVNNGTAGTFRDLKLRNLIATGYLTLDGTSISSASGTLSLGGAVRTTVGAAGGGDALPATPTGYIDAYIGSTAVGIPYFARGA